MRLVTLFTAVALGLAACGSSQPITLATPTVPEAYQARVDTGPNGEPIQIPAVRAAYLTERNQRQRVPYNGPEAPGTIVVDPYARVLYDVLEGGEAMRFGIAVGRAGTGFAGSGTIRRKAAWPSWTPTANMVRTEPELYGPVRNGLPGGPQNPLGARALYLYNDKGQDTAIRIHGTTEPNSIGRAVSNGCLRMRNEAVMALYDQVPIGTPVYVY